MKSMKKQLFLLALFASVFAPISHATKLNELAVDDDDNDSVVIPASDLPYAEFEDLKLTSLRGTGRFFSHKFGPFQLPSSMKCDRYPKVCRVKGSPGRVCCKKKCVNVKSDRYNCGRCGKKCKYSEICCKGKCVNPMMNRNHCGGCNSKCNRGSLCVYGMCGYA